jgi:hypothetical protein
MFCASASSAVEFISQPSAKADVSGSDEVVLQSWFFQKPVLWWG